MITLEKMDLGLFIQKLKNKDFFLKCAHVHRAFSRINHMLGHKVSLGKLEKIGIMSSNFFNCNTITLEINYKKRNKAPTPGS